MTRDAREVVHAAVLPFGLEVSPRVLRDAVLDALLADARSVVLHRAEDGTVTVTRVEAFVSHLGPDHYLDVAGWRAVTP